VPGPVAWDFAYDESRGPSAYPLRAPITAPFTQSGAYLMHGGKRLRIIGGMLSEGALCALTNAEVDAIAQGVIQSGVRMVYAQASVGRVYNEGGNTTNWGLAQHAATEGITDNTLNAARMDAFARLIWRLGEGGVFVMINVNFSGSTSNPCAYLVRLGMPTGTYLGHCTWMVAPSAMAALKGQLDHLLDYVSAYTGLTIAAHKNVSIKISNEDGLHDSLLSKGAVSFGGGRTYSPFFDGTSTNYHCDQVVLSLNGNGYYKTEFDAAWSAASTYVAANYEAWSGTPWASFPNFPARADVDANNGNAVNKRNIRRTVRRLESLAYQELENHVKAKSGTLYVMRGDGTYLDPYTTLAPEGYTDPPMQSIHIYMGTGAGAPGADQVNYPQRGAIFAYDWTAWDTSTWYGSFVPGYRMGCRRPNQPACITEWGEYGEGQFCGGVDLMYSALILMMTQDWDAFLAFKGASQKPAYLGTGEVHDSVITRRPGFGLAVRATMPCAEEYADAFNPLPSHTTTVTELDIANENDGAGNGVDAVNYQPGGGGGNASAIWAKRHYIQIAGTANLDTANYGSLNGTTYNNSTVTSPITITTNADASPQVRVFDGGSILTLKRADGTWRAVWWHGEIPTGGATLGPLTVGPIGESTIGQVLSWRSDGDYPLGGAIGESRLYLHGADYPTDCTNIDMTTQATGVSSDGNNGTLPNVRLWQLNAPPQLNLAVTGKKRVYGVSASGGSWVELTPSVNNGTTLTFQPLSAYPEMILTQEAVTIQMLMNRRAALL
jgi:hypothetical protein